MKNQVHLIFTFFAFSLFISCGSIHEDRLYQSPNQDGMPRLQKKNDGDISYGQKIPFVDKDSLTYYRNIQISYSPIKHLGFSIGHSRLKSKTTNKSKIYTSNAAIGGYYFFQTKRRIRKNGLQTPATATMPRGILFDLYGGLEVGAVENYIEEVSSPNNFQPIELYSNFQLRKYFLRGGIHIQRKLFGLSLICKAGQFNYTKGFINLEGETSSRLLDEFFLISNFQSGQYLEPTVKIFLGEENIQGFFGVTQLYTFHDLGLDEKDQLIYFGLSVDIDNFYRGFRRNKKKKN